MNTLYKDYFKDTVVYAGGSARPDTGQKIYKLSSNENMLGCSPKVQAAIAAQLDHLNTYPPPSDTELRTKIADHLGHKLTADHIIAANGGVNIINLIVSAFLGEGLECIVPYPSFTPYFGMPTQMGAKVIKVPLIGDQFALDIEGIISAITPQTRLICLASPNNPLGTIITQSAQDTLMAHVPDHVLVIYDEVYHHYVTATDYARPIRYIQEGRPVVALNSFSKAYGLAALRIGYAYTTVEVASYLNHFMRPFFINQLSQQAAIAALDDTDFVDEVVALTLREKHFLYQSFDDLGITYWRSEGNFILVKPKMSEAAFVDALLGHGVMVRGGSSFEAPGHVRITVGDREANEALVRALQVIA